jgi:hypothetical protein
VSWWLVPFVALVLLALHGPGWWYGRGTGSGMAWGVIGILAAGGLGLVAHVAMQAGLLAVVACLGFGIAAVATRRIALPVAASIIGTGTAAAALVLPAASTLGYNVNDDTSGYLYLAERIRTTGTLIDAFNARRLFTLGGADYLHALFLPLWGRGSLHVLDAVIAPAMLACLLAAAPREASWPRRAVCCVAGLALALFLVPPRDNSSPYVLSLVFLVLAALATRDVLQRAGLEPVLRLGALFAAAFVLRSSVAVAFVPLLALAEGVLLWRRRWRDVGALAGTAVVAVLPWSLVAWQSERNPLYPLTPGYADPNFPGFRSPVAHAARISLDRFLAYGVVKEMAVALAVSALLAVLAHGRRAGSAVVVAVAVGGGLATLLLVTNLTLYIPWDQYRYCWGVLVATPVTAAVVLLHAPPAERRVPRLGVIAAAVVGLVAVVLPVPVSAATGPFDVGVHTWVREQPPLVTDTLSTQWDTTFESTALQLYRTAQSHTTPGSKVFSATDFPWAFDLNRNRIDALDLIGFASPGSHLPMNGKPGSVWTYLLAQGYDYAVVSDPHQLLDASGFPGHLPGVFNVDRLADSAGWADPLHAWVPYYKGLLDTFAADLQPGRAGLTRVGPLWVVDLHAQRPYLASLGSHD